MQWATRNSTSTTRWLFTASSSSPIPRPLYAGDEVVVDSVVADIAAVGRNELADDGTTRQTLDGELIVTTRSVTVSRGTAPQEG